MSTLPKIELPDWGEFVGTQTMSLEEDTDADIAYNAHCTGLIRDALLKQREQGIEPPKLRTFWPHDDDESADTVSLDRDGDVVVIDSGSR